MLAMENILISSSIIKNEKYDTILIPLKNINKKFAIIFPNVLSMLNYKNIVDNIIVQFDSSLLIDIYKLYHQEPNDNNIIYKKYTTSPNNYNNELIETWMPEMNNDEIDSLEINIKVQMFENSLKDVLFDEYINDIIVFGSCSSIYESIMMDIKTYENIQSKNIIYISFDTYNQDIMYNLYVNKDYKNYRPLINLFDDINKLITSNLTIKLPPRLKPPTIIDERPEDGINNIPDIFTDEDVIISYKGLLNNIEDVKNNKYFCLTMLNVRNQYIYKFKKFKTLKQYEIHFKDISNHEINLRGLSSLLLYMDTCYLVENIEIISNIIQKLDILPNKNDNKKLSKYYEVILDKHSELLTISKNNFIESNKIQIKTDKFNIIELLQNFAKNEQFKFTNIKRQIKQNNNIIKNYASITKCQDDVIVWEKLFKSFYDSNNDDSLMNISCDLYNLLLSRTNWYDELQSGNISGLLIQVITPKLAKLGIIMDKIKIEEISNNLITFEQICEAQDIYISDKKHYDNGRINDSCAIYGNALGNGNCILPLYINDIHWKLAKTQLRYSMGIAINQNPFDYYNKHFELYPMTLLKLIQDMISNRNNITDKHIITFIQLTITVNLIFKDIFKCNINKITLDQCYNMFNDPINRTEQFFDNIDCLLGFTLISQNNYISNKINKFKTNHINNVFVEELRRTLKQIYKTHIPLTKSNIDVNQIWNNFFSINKDEDNPLCYDFIMELLKFNYDKYDDILINDDNKRFPIDCIFENLFDNYDILNSTYKIICWSLINQINNETTIEHLNKVINNKYGDINNDTIKYFKDQFINLHNRYKNFESNDNKLLFFNITDNYKIKQQCLILQNIATRDKKYFSQHYSFNVLSDPDNTLYDYYYKLTLPYINKFFNELNYNTMDHDAKKKYIKSFFDIIQEINVQYISIYTKYTKQIIPLSSDNNNNNIHKIVTDNIYQTQNKHIDSINKHIINALLYNRSNIPFVENKYDDINFIKGIINDKKIIYKY